MLEREDESMSLIDNTIEDRMITNSELETSSSGSGGGSSGDTAFDKLPRKAKELLMFQNRLRSRFLESSPKKQYHLQFDSRNRGNHHSPISMRRRQNHRGRRFGVFKPNMLSSKKRFLLTKNKHPWMRQNVMGIF